MWNPSDFESDDLDGFNLDLDSLEESEDQEEDDDYDDSWDEIGYDPYSGSYDHETQDWNDDRDW